MSKDKLQEINKLSAQYDVPVLILLLNSRMKKSASKTKPKRHRQLNIWRNWCAG
ncbi:hypothetical protein O9929_15185 [Vibrio lentus]|nr:hypothetical protein [Vibrio lentus]